MDLSNRVAIVTGASRGIGRATAVRLASLGARVVINYHSSEECAREVVSQIAELGSEGVAVKADVARDDAGRVLVEAAIDTYGRLDILVNNAGIARDGLLMRMSAADWDAVLTTNLKGVFNCTKAVLRTMMRKRYGRIVNVSSVSGVKGNVGQTNYSAAKAGIIGFTKALAKEVGSRGITVNAVAPGYIRSDMTMGLPEDVLSYAVEHTPLRRIGESEEVASAIAFLASEEAGFITGQVLQIDGGLGI